MKRVLAVCVLVVAALPLGGTVAGRQSEVASAPLTLWYRQPAAQWVEALPIGNGRLSAMVFGGVAEERLQLNEDTLWSGGPYDPANPDASTRHSGGSNIIFAHGHVRWQRWQSIRWEQTCPQGVNSSNTWCSTP